MSECSTRSAVVLYGASVAPIVLWCSVVLVEHPLCCCASGAPIMYGDACHHSFLPLDLHLHHRYRSSFLLCSPSSHELRVYSHIDIITATTTTLESIAIHHSLTPALSVCEPAAYALALNWNPQVWYILNGLLIDI